MMDDTSEKRLVYLDDVLADLHEVLEAANADPDEIMRMAEACVGTLIKHFEEFPTVDAVKLPCKIGDFVWAIRSYNGHKHPQRGVVSEMYFARDMKLQIVVKHVARGEWGKTVFATDKEAYAAIGERDDKE